MRGATLAALVALATAAPSLAEDHLVPEHSIIGGSDFSPGYQAMVQNYFADFYKPEVRARMIIEPSFSPEVAIGLRGTTGSNGARGTIAHFTVAIREPKRQLYGYWTLAAMRSARLTREGKLSPATQNELAELERKFPGDFHDTESDDCTAEIDAAHAQRVLTVWKTMLLDTRFVQPAEESVLTTDGISYHFSMFSDITSGWLAGETRSGTPEDGPPAALVDVGLSLLDYCRKNDPSPLNVSLKKLEDLLKKKHP